MVINLIVNSAASSVQETYLSPGSEVVEKLVNNVSHHFQSIDQLRSRRIPLQTDKILKLKHEERSRLSRMRGISSSRGPLKSGLHFKKLSFSKRAIVQSVTVSREVDAKEIKKRIMNILPINRNMNS